MNESKVVSIDYFIANEASATISPEIARAEKFIRKKLNKKSLANRLNFVHFNDEIILIRMKHKRYETEISLKAKPKPCTTNTLECQWLQVPGLAQKIKNHEFKYFLLSDGLKLIQVEAAAIKMDEQGIILDLPDFCYELSSRRVRRHQCTGIEAKLMQHGVVFSGRLIDFSSIAFKVEVIAKPPQTFHWIQTDQPVHVILSDKDQVYYSGDTNIVRHTPEQCKRHYVLEPLKKSINRFKIKHFPSIRHILNPSPNMIFTHPLTRQVITLPVYDISGSGFSVEENEEQSVLLPGLIIPVTEIEIANKYSLKCLTQVIYRKKIGQGEKEGIKCGLAILDMNIQDQMKLSGMLQRSNNKNTFVCNRVNIENLWKFFFDAGFIYPQKYNELYYNKENFKKIYEKLYVEHPQIARHFIYQDKGLIYGHMSMLRYFTNTWLFHHHASTSAVFRGPGIAVLEQICDYVNDFYQQYSTHMSYIVCYYRSNNRFPNRIFGNFAETLNDPDGCCVYPMAYINYQSISNPKSRLPKCISIDPSRYEDLLELKGSFGKEYGNLIFHALDFEEKLYNRDTVAKEYDKIGFKREKHIFSIKINGELKAIALVLLSETGINLSNLTNCIYLFVVDNQELSDKHFKAVINRLQKMFKNKSIPILTYPVEFVKNKEIPYDKIYHLWVFNTMYLDKFLKYTNRLFK